MQIFKAKENLSVYCSKRAINIKNILAILPGEYRKEEFHQLRIEIKKLNAILELISCSCNNFKKNKYFKPFKKIFIQSGKIRELQLEESLLEKYNTRKIEEVLLKVKRDIKKEQKKFYQLITKIKKRKIKRIFKKIVLCLETISDKKVNDFIEGGKSKISRLTMDCPLDENNLHELRKSLKRDFFSRDSLNLRDRNKREEEDNLQELIGNWHDSETMSNLIEKSIIKKKINTEELTQLIQIDEEIGVSRRLLFEKINAAVETTDIFS